MQQVVETLDGTGSPWAAAAYAQLAQWVLMCGGVAEVAEAEELADAAARLPRNRRDPLLEPLLHDLRVQLVYGDDAPAASECSSGSP